MKLREAVDIAKGIREFRNGKLVLPVTLSMLALLDFAERLAAEFTIAAEYLPDGEQYAAGQELVEEINAAGLGEKP